MEVVSNLDYFYLFTATFLLVGLLTPLMRKLALKNNIVDHPNSTHKTHQDPIPYLGGVAIILGILIVAFAALQFSGRISTDFWVAASLLFPATILGYIGYLDDRKNLAPLPRFLAQTIAGIFTASILLATSTIGNPSGNPILDALITVVWVVGISNSINFFDNLDGGAAGAVAATTLGIFLISIDNGQILLGALSITTFGAMLGFLIWNKSPARIYMGDAGALFLGILVAVLALRLNPDVAGKTTSFAIPLFLLAVPILDTSVAVLSRIKRGISPFQGGRDHLSHRLLRMGLTKRQAALALWTLSALFAGVAVGLATLDVNSDLLLTLSFGLWLVLFISFFVARDTDSIESYK